MVRFILHPVPSEPTLAWSEEELIEMAEYIEANYHLLMVSTLDDIGAVVRRARRHGLFMRRDFNFWRDTPCQCNMCKNVCMALVMREVMMRGADDSGDSDDEVIEL